MARFTLLVALLAVLSVPAVGAPERALRRKKDPPRKAAPEHLFLLRRIGVWETEMRVKPRPSSRGGTSKSKHTVRAILSGSFWEVDTVDSFGDLASKMIAKYDGKKEAATAWLFNMSGAVHQLHGKCDKSTKEMVWTCTDTEGTRITSRERFVDDDTVSFEFMAKDKNGKIKMAMTGTMRRVKN